MSFREFTMIDVREVLRRWQAGHPRNEARRDRAARLARDRGVSVAQLCLGYLRAQPLDVRPIVAASTPERLQTLLAAPPLALTPDELAWLDDGGPGGPSTPTDPARQ